MQGHVAQALAILHVAWASPEDDNHPRSSDALNVGAGAADRSSDASCERPNHLIHNALRGPTAMNRPITNLTNEQLQRKRAFDRVNQRASRARKKNRVQELEEEVSDLKHRLARSEDLVKRLQHSESCLREIINSARASLQTVDHHKDAPNQASEQPQLTTSDAGHPSDDALRMITSRPRTASSEILQETAPSVLSSISSQPGQLPPTDGTTEHGLDAVTLRDADTGLSLDLSLSPSNPVFDIWGEGPSKSLDNASLSVLTSTGLDLQGSSTLSLAFLDAGFPDTPYGALSDWSLAGSQHIQPIDKSFTQTQIWEDLPLHIAPTCQLDKVLLNLVASSREQLQASGRHPEASFPSIKSLLNPAARDAENPISNALGQHGKVTMAVAGSPERVACLYYLGLYLRWLISPTRRNFEAMPSFLRPVEAQLTKPHPIWIDTLVWYMIILN